MEIAAVYAMGATYAGFWDGQYRMEDPNAYPVILSLDVSGLKAEPDVDALAQAAYLLGENFLREQYRGMGLDEADEMEERDYDFIRIDADTGSAVMEMSVYGSGPPGAFLDLPDGEEQWQVWLDTGAYTNEAAIELVKQKRYLSDFGFDRLVRVYAMKPWWPYLLEDWDAGEEAEQAIETVEAAGYNAITVESILNMDVLELREVFSGQDEPNVEYHGTSSTSAQLAFPELQLPQNPFPIQVLRDKRMKRLKNKLLK